MAELVTGIHLMAKPVGPICNLDCGYCFYLEKESLFPEKQKFSMSDEVLRAYVEQNIRNEPSPEVLFTWQGGEPMLRGLDFYQRAVALQQELAGGKTIRNVLQTNGVLLDDEWAAFLARNHFMVGLSLDGPREIHDAFRVDKRGRPTFDAVLSALHLLQKYCVEVNVLVTVNSLVAKHPLHVYEFLKQQGVTHMQFNPVVERRPSEADTAIGLTFAEPPKSGQLIMRTGQAADASRAPVTEHSVSAEAYGDFLIAIFDQWVRHDVGDTYVMNFEWALAAWLQLPATLCLFAENCGKALIVEHNGDVYSCDHYMYPDYRLGNLQSDNLMAMANSERQKAFGQGKSASLPQYCRDCEVKFACNGECPKNRFIQTPDGEPGLNYLCVGYKKYFRHIDQYMRAMAQLIHNDQPASLIRQAFLGPLIIPASSTS